jgi:hypothetical protein
MHINNAGRSMFTTLILIRDVFISTSSAQPALMHTPQPVRASVSHLGVLVPTDGRAKAHPP